jgi:hypothetical protein
MMTGQGKVNAKRLNLYTRAAVKVILMKMTMNLSSLLSKIPLKIYFIYLKLYQGSMNRIKKLKFLILLRKNPTKRKETVYPLEDY